MKKYDIIVKEKNSEIEVFVNPLKGAKQTKETFEIEFCNNDTNELLYTEPYGKPGMYFVCTVRHANVLIKITQKGKELFQKLIPKITKNIKVSIVIPTMTFYLIQKCIDSIIKYTNLEDVEIVVVANGADIILKEYISKLSKEINIKLLWFDTPIGAVPALNEGIKNSNGEYILLLNDDVEILQSNKNDWFIELLKPLEENSKIACTGPSKLYPIIGQRKLNFNKDDFNYGFIIFYCAMIPSRIFKEIGLLETKLKCGVDIDFCMNLKRHGYEIKKIGGDDNTYPIYHIAEETVHKFYGIDEWNRIIEKDSLFLENKYSSFNSHRTSHHDNKLISIVIPTMTREYTNNCVRSIINSSNTEDMEIIVVANGAEKELKDDIKNFQTSGLNIKLLWFDTPIGAVPALNEGIKNSNREYVLLLNDDCQIYFYERKNYWIELLLEPFIQDQKMGCTGPFKMDSSVNKELLPQINTEFIIFFCALIPNKIFKEIGLLDENLKCGCDIDFCIRLKLAGYKIQQTPDQELKFDPDKPKMLIGDFPIYHMGEGTVEKHYGHEEWHKIIKEDIEILNNKYKDLSCETKTEIEVVKINPKNVLENLPEGYFGDWDVAVYRQMVSSLPDNGTFVEIGSLLGRGLCSVSDLILKKNLKVISVDLFNDFYEPMFDKHFPNQLNDFISNIKKFGIYEHVEIKKGPSVEIAKEIPISSVDFVFIDANHDYDFVKEDINNWYPKIKPDGIIAGHDFEWPSVKQAIDDTLGLENVSNEYQKVCSFNIWSTRKPKIYDGFIFFNELDILEMRLSELNDVVSKFIIVEGTMTHSGKINDKRYFLNNLNRFKKYKDKIIYLVDNFEEVVVNNSWDLERHQRDFIKNGWKSLTNNDAIIISDCDEIPNPEAIANYKLKDGFSSFLQKLYYDYINCYCQEWEWAKIVPFAIAKTMTPCQIRYTEAQNKIQNGGWHFSFMGGPSKIKEKMISYAHQEYNTPEFLDRINIALDKGEDIFKREGITKTIVPIDGSYPKYVLKNYNMLDYKGYIKTFQPERVRPLIDISWYVFQKKYELMMIQEFFRYEKLSKVLEIGTAFGGTARLWAEMVDPENGKVYCCDLSFDHNNDLTSHGIAGYGYTDTKRVYYPRQVYNDTPFEKRIIEFPGNSHDPEYIQKVKSEVGIVDFLFIDGDHSYEGVKQDFENFYSTVKIGGYIAFHDIIDSHYHRDQGCFVNKFWDEIKEYYEYYEFLDQNWYEEKGPAKSMGIGLIVKRSEIPNHLLNKHKISYSDNKISYDKKENISGSDVLCSICTKNRYDSTLPLAIQSVIMQTVKPAKLLIYDDNTEQDTKDLRGIETYNYLFQILSFYNIDCQVIFGLKKGQHHGHQLANKQGYKYVWRLDDDEIAEPTVLEKYLRLMKDDVGAVGGAVLTNGYGGVGSPKLENIYNMANIQWTAGNKIIEVDHLHSTFLYRANIIDYCLDLSPVAHREETIFSHELKEKGYKLLVDLSAITQHLKQQKTGIRSHNSEWLYKHDEKIFTKKMESWGYKLINLNSGIGDHYAFLNILPELKKKWKHLIIGACFPEVFHDEKDITLIHIFESEPINDENIYKWMIDKNWTKSIVEAYAEYYGVKI